MGQVSQGYYGTVQLMDVGRKTITKTYQFNGSQVDFPAALVDMATLITALEGVSDLEVLGYQVKEVFQEDTLVVPVALNAQAEMHALLNVGIEGQPLKTATMRIPGPKEAIFVGNPGTDDYDNVDGANAAVIAFMDLFKQTGGDFWISDGEDIADAGSFKSGRRVHSKSRRG
jgi:hypothetical protein